MNWPPADRALDTYDLRIEQDKNEDLDVKDGEARQKAETKKKDLSEAVGARSSYPTSTTSMPEKYKET